MSNTIDIYTDAELAAQVADSGIVDAFIASLDVRMRTKDAYRKRISYFLYWLDANGIEQPRRADILEYKAYLMESHSIQTASAYLSTIRIFFSWLNSETGYPNISQGIRNPKSRRAGRLKDALSAEQAIRLLDAIGRDTLAGKRDYSICSLMIYTGLRTVEVSRAEVGDMRYMDGFKVLYVWGKGRDDRDEYVKLAQTVQDAISEYMDAREIEHGKAQADSPLFLSASKRNYGSRLSARSISRIAKDAMRNIGLDDSRLTAHSFRHTAVTLALKGGAGIRDAQQMARHGSPVTTERYAHDIRRLEDAAEDAVAGILEREKVCRNYIQSM